MNKDKELQIAQIKGKTAIATAIIGSIGVIVAAIIGIFSIALFFSLALSSISNELFSISCRN